MTENNKNKKKWYKDPFKWGVIILSVLTVIFFAVILFDAIEESAGSLLGLTGDTAKNDTLSFIGIAMGGALVALQAIAAYRRAKAMEDVANAQATAANAQAEASKAHAQANQYTERGQRQERLKNAIEHLGHKSDSVRLGGAYELFHLAEDNKKLRQTVLDILCAHIRRTTSEKKYRNNYTWRPSEEIQSLLTLLFVRDHRVFSGCYINLQASWLNGANLKYAKLACADLSYGNYIVEYPNPGSDKILQRRRPFVVGRNRRPVLDLALRRIGRIGCRKDATECFLRATDVQLQHPRLRAASFRLFLAHNCLVDSLW